ATMKKMFATRHHHNRQILRACPIEHRCKWHYVVQFAVYHQGVFGHSLSRKTIHCRANQHHALARNALGDARDALAGEWEAMQAQAVSAPPEGRAGIEYQLRRLVRENLLKELAVRAVLPSHGLPTGVVSFVHADKPAADEKGEGEDTSRRRNFPSRTLDIAIRDYAPGAEVVVDGLVNLVGSTSLALGNRARELQTGHIYSYLYAIVIGVVVVMFARLL
ncbi:MAG: hypothetical protein WCG92_26505, partial [Hyphomicrobiales bacterium]